MIHIPNVKTAVKKVLVAYITVLVVFLVATTTFEWLSPVTAWYEYDTDAPVELVKIDKSRIAYFHSNSVWYRDIQMEWYDTLFCTDGEHSRKINTQTWKEYMKAGRTPSDEVWKYKYPVPRDAVECMLCGNMVGTTKHGFLKKYSYCTKEFDVKGI